MTDHPKLFQEHVVTWLLNLKEGMGGSVSLFKVGCLNKAFNSYVIAKFGQLTQQNFGRYFSMNQIVPVFYSLPESFDREDESASLLKIGNDKRKIQEAWESEIFGGSVFSAVRVKELALLKSNASELPRRKNALFKKFSDLSENSRLYKIRNVQISNNQFIDLDLVAE